MKETNLIAHHWIIFNQAFVEARAHSTLWTTHKDPRQEVQFKIMRRDRIDKALERWRNETRS